MKKAAVPLVVLMALSFAVFGPAPVQATGVRASLDTGQLEFGLANDPAGSTATDLNWMTNSGVPWKYRYHYLSGGSGSSNSAWWTGSTWAQDYMTESTTSPANYLPVMSYYMMCQALPQSPGCGFPNDGVQDFNILQNASSMSTYYADFRTLLQQAGSYGKPVIIHVEPDLWGLMQQKAVSLGQTTASGVPAKVKSSGFTDVHVNFSSFNDDFQSFACSLLKLRDAYAPNALMAIHASPWSAGPDIASDPSSLSEKTLADATAVFLNSSCLSSNPFGGSTWDLVFNDVDDHDAAWWEVNGFTNSGFTHWWDPTNTVFPNFTRYLSWVSELKLKTARPQIVWQVPMGNQYFETEDNSAGHLQDTVAQYFIAHPDALYSAGLIAVLFGAGNGGQTNYGDTNGDGITNGPGHGTLDAATVAWCSACNTHVSTSSDDDGGFIRTFVGQYYASHHVGRQPANQSTAGAPPSRSPVAQSSASTPPGARTAQTPLQPPAGAQGQEAIAAASPPVLAAQLPPRFLLIIKCLRV